MIILMADRKAVADKKITKAHPRKKYRTIIKWDKKSSKKKNTSHNQKINYFVSSVLVNPSSSKIKLKKPLLSCVCTFHMYSLQNTVKYRRVSLHLLS